jgi:AcrR family transcriptional regulator
MSALEQDPVRPTRARGPYSKTAQRRLDILDAALDVFAQSGYRAGSLREVAGQVGISEAGVLHHFPSKSRLLTAVLEHRDELSRQAVAFDPEDGLGTLVDLVDLARHNAATPGVVELYCTLSAEATSPDHPAHGYFVERYRELRRTVGGAFADLERRGHLAPGIDVATATASSIALWDGLQVQWLLEPGAVDMADQLAAHFRRLLVVDLPHERPQPPDPPTHEEPPR